ncbi:MAG: superoxide dismutase [Cytophagales bacterium]|nr:superoxide dismutase [Armatimonadota bacterium]
MTSRRTFLKGAALLAPATLLTGGSLLAVPSSARAQPAAPKEPDTGSGPYLLPPLAYPFNALEPHIDGQTMQIHHDRHHTAYVKNLNEAVAKAPRLKGATPDALIRDLGTVPEAIRTAVRNNAGGHLNHTMFWAIMSPKGGGEPTGAIREAITGTFGSFAAFQTAFNDAGVKRFGSGWVWLVQTKAGKLEILTTPNQDSPLLAEYASYPILGNDVWEHAYYLKYQNRRPDYLKAWWNVVDWKAVNQRFAAAKAV